MRFGRGAEEDGGGSLQFQTHEQDNGNINISKKKYVWLLQLLCQEFLGHM